MTKQAKRFANQNRDKLTSKQKIKWQIRQESCCSKIQHILRTTLKTLS